MRQARRGCGIATSLALILSLLPTPAYALRKAQDEAKTSGLEETLRAGGAEEGPAVTVRSLTPKAIEEVVEAVRAADPNTPQAITVVQRFLQAVQMGQQLPEATAHWEDQLNPAGPIPGRLRLVAALALAEARSNPAATWVPSASANDLEAIEGFLRKRYEAGTARSVLTGNPDHREAQALLTRAQALYRATGLEETPKDHVVKTLTALHLFFASLAEEVLSNKDGLPKVPAGFSRAVKGLLPSYRQDYGLDLSAEDVTKLLTGNRRVPPERLELEQATLLAWADLVVTELGNRFIEGRPVGDVDGILSAVRNAAKPFTADDVKLGSMMWARYAASPSDASLKGLIQRLQAQFHLATGLEEGTALPLDEASRTLELYHRAEGVNAVQVGPDGRVQRLFTQTDNTLTPINDAKRTELLEQVAVQGRVVPQPRDGQPLLVRAPTAEELQKAGVTTGLEEKQTRAAAEHAAVVDELRKQAVAAWKEQDVRQALQPGHPWVLGAPTKPVIVFRNPSAYRVKYIPLFVMLQWDVAVEVADPKVRAKLKTVLDGLEGPKGSYSVGSSPQETERRFRGREYLYDTEQAEFKYTMSLLRWNRPVDDLPSPIGTAATRTYDYLTAKTGLESGA